MPDIPDIPDMPDMPDMLHYQPAAIALAFPRNKNQTSPEIVITTYHSRRQCVVITYHSVMSETLRNGIPTAVIPSRYPEMGWFSY